MGGEPAEGEETNEEPQEIEVRDYFTSPAIYDVCLRRDAACINMHVLLL